MNDKDRFFCTQHLKTGLRGKVVKSTFFTISAQGIKFVASLASTAILARLLLPADFGLVAMVAVFGGLALQAMNNGFSMAIIQSKEINHREASNIFWVNVIVGSLLWIAFIVFAPAVAWIYKEPSLYHILIAYSSVFLITAFSAPQIAVLRRQMRYGELAAIEVASMVIGTIGGIIAAIYGFGYWALVFSFLSIAVINVFLSWYVSRWIPGRYDFEVPVGSHLRYGLHLALADVVGYFSTNFVPFLVGIIGNASILGIYNRSFTLSSLPSKQLIPPILNVMQSALSRVADDDEKLRRVSISLMRKVAFLSLLVSVCMYAGSNFIVKVVLGEGWEDAIAMMEVLIISTVAIPITSLTSAILIAKGESKALLHWRLITFFILLVPVLIGSFWGVWGVIYSYAIVTVGLRMPLFFFYVRNHQPVQPMTFIEILSFPAFAGVLAVALSHSLTAYMGMEQFLFGIFGVFSAGIIYLLACALVPSLREEMKYFVSFVLRKLSFVGR